MEILIGQENLPISYHVMAVTPKVTTHQIDPGKNMHGELSIQPSNFLNTLEKMVMFISNNQTKNLEVSRNFQRIIKENYSDNKKTVSKLSCKSPA